MGLAGQGPPALVRWAPSVGVLVISILKASEKSYVLGYLGIYGISGEAQH